MPGFESSIRIEASPEKVWPLLSDASRYDEWVTVTDRVIDAGGDQMKVGTVYREYGGIPPFKAESTWHVTEFTPYSRQVHVGDDGSMRIVLEIDLARDGEGTQFTQKLKFTPRWFMIPVAYPMWFLMMGRRGKAAIEETQANLKRLVEAAGT